MDINAVLSELGGQIGLEGLKLDENGVCRLVFDDVLVVDIESSDDGQVVNLHAQVCEIPAEGREELYKVALEESLFGLGTGGASFGLDSQRGELLLWRSLAMDKLDYQDFVNILESFVNHLELWMQKVERSDFSSDSNSGGEGDSEDVAQDDDSSDSAGFIRA